MAAASLRPRKILRASTTGSRSRNRGKKNAGTVTAGKNPLCCAARQPARVGVGECARQIDCATHGGRGSAGGGLWDVESAPGTKLSVLITPVITTPFRTQYKSLPVIQPDGTFASEPLGNAEVGMLPYKYDIVTQVLELSKQPDEVRAHFQDQPANLHGPLLVQAGQKERIEVIVPLELREYDPNMPLPERRQLHAAHVERYLTELKSLFALLQEKQKILEERSFDTTVNYNWPAIKSRLDVLRRDRRMAGEFSELNQPFRHAEQQLEYYQQVLETKQGQFWDSARAQFEKVLSEAEQGLRNF